MVHAATERCRGRRKSSLIPQNLQLQALQLCMAVCSNGVRAGPTRSNLTGSAGWLPPLLAAAPIPTGAVVRVPHVDCRRPVGAQYFELWCFRHCKI